MLFDLSENITKPDERELKKHMDILDMIEEGTFGMTKNNVPFFIDDWIKNFPEAMEIALSLLTDEQLGNYDNVYEKTSEAMKTTGHRFADCKDEFIIMKHLSKYERINGNINVLLDTFFNGNEFVTMD